MTIAKLAGSSCAVSRSLAVLGERWTLLIIRDALAGITRFESFRESLHIGADVLAERLSTLVEFGVLEKRGYQEPGSRTRHEYHLTEAGRQLHVVIGGLQLWGDTNLPWPSGPSTERRDRDTGRRVQVAFIDESGRQLPEEKVDIIHHNDFPARPRSTS